MRVLDYILLAVIFLWLWLVLLNLYKKKKSGRCIGCIGGNCVMCDKKTQK